MAKYTAKPIKVEAFTFGIDKQPGWYLKAVRLGTIKLQPAKGTIVTKTESGQFNLYDQRTFNALFETEQEAKDLDKDGVIDAREEALATETKKKRTTRKKSVPKDTENPS